MAFVEAKIGKRIGVVNRETNPSKQPAPRRYVAGLSFGSSSSAMTRVLDNSAKYHSSRESSTAFEPLVVHIDTDLSTPSGESTPAQRLLEEYKETFQNVKFDRVPLEKALELDTIDWSTLQISKDGDAREALDGFLAKLPSVTSRVDVTRLLVRHLLLDITITGSYNALMLGHNTTSLAALTLSEVANGRGFSVPWQVNDGPYNVHSHTLQSTEPDTSTTKASVPLYYPMREVFRNEVLTYVDLTPLLRRLIQDDERRRQAVVSHKDTSIDDVMTRYFDGVEGPFAGIVANVVRTSGKLVKRVAEDFCGLCGLGLDEFGDSRWAGELGEDGFDEHDAAPSRGGRLCYGCRRSIYA